MVNHLMTQAWRPWTDAESNQSVTTPKKWLPIFPITKISIQDGYQHIPLDAGDSRHLVSDTHLEDTWN